MPDGFDVYTSTPTGATGRVLEFDAHAAAAGAPPQNRHLLTFFADGVVGQGTNQPLDGITEGAPE